MQIGSSFMAFKGHTKWGTINLYIYIHIHTYHTRPDQTKGGFVMMLIWFWYGFDAIFGRCCVSDMILICVRNIFRKQCNTKKNRNHILDPNHKWNHINIITAKPGHKQIITANHIWIISKSLEKKETLHLRVCWCVTHTMTYQYSTVRYMHTYKTGVR